MSTQGVDKISKQQIKIIDRKTIEADGVESVITFDEDYVLLSTINGRVEINGRQLKIVDLSQSTGKILITGVVNGVCYEGGEKKKGFFR